MLYNFSQLCCVSNEGLSNSRLSSTSISLAPFDGSAAPAPSDGAWAGATGGDLANVSATSAVVENVRLGAVATERWAIALDGAALSWRVTRTFAAPGVTTYADRSPMLHFCGQRTVQVNEHGPDFIHRTPSSQIPSFLDPAQALNATRAGGNRLGGGGGWITVQGEQGGPDSGLWYEALSPSKISRSTFTHWG